MDPDVSSRHVKPVGVEGGEVDEAVVVFVGSASTEHKTEMAKVVFYFYFFSLQPDLAIADFQSINTVDPKCPVRRIQKEKILNQKILGVLDVEEPGSVLSPDEVSCITVSLVTYFCHNHVIRKN